MPHIVIKMYPGRSGEIKENLARKVAETVKEELQIDASAISVSVEEIPKEDWKEQVYDGEIKNNANVYVKPGYEM